jgi:hypothetical protein
MTGIGIGPGFGVVGVGGASGLPYSPLTKSIYLNEGDVLTDQILNIGNPLDSVTQNDPFSACLWVNYDHTAGGAPAILFNKYYSGGPRGWYVADMGSGSLRVYFQWGTVPTGVAYKDFASTGADSGSWHMLVLTYDGSANVSGIKLYMDGVGLTATTTSGTTLNNTIATTYAFGVARAANSGLYYAYVGLILHCAAWTAELTPAEVAAVYGGGLPQNLLSIGPTTDLAFWHSLGDGSTHANPGGIPDLSGNGHDGAWWDNNGGFSTDVP